MIHVFYAKPSATRDTSFFGMVKYSPSDALKEQVLSAVKNPENYEHVTSFGDHEARDLDDVWEAMQAECSNRPRELRTRSMMVGDILIYEGDVFVVDSAGFEKLDVEASRYTLRSIEG